MRVYVRDLDLDEREKKRFRYVCVCVCMCVYVFFGGRAGVNVHLFLLSPLFIIITTLTLTHTHTHRCLVGSRYNPGKDELTLVSGRFMNRGHNKQYLLYLLDNLIAEAKGEKIAEAAL